jgi:hypothetical protein
MCGPATLSLPVVPASSSPAATRATSRTRPYQFSFRASAHVQTVMFSRDALRLSPSQLERLTTRRINGQEGLGFLVSQYLVALGRQVDTGVCSASWHLAEATLDLLAASFAERLACTGTTDLDSGKTGLLLRVQAYIKHRLGDPHLDVATIAGPIIFRFVLCRSSSKARSRRLPAGSVPSASNTAAGT